MKATHEGHEVKKIYRPPPEAMVRQQLAKHGVLAVRLVGHPGCGKTQLIESTLKSVPNPNRTAVITINPAAGRDAQRLSGLCAHVAPIDSAVPHASAVWNILSQWPLEKIELILVETAGGLGNMQDLGQDATVAVFAVSGGDDKAVEYGNLIRHCSAVVLTKADLHTSVRFDDAVFRQDVQELNPSAHLVVLSAVTGAGMPNWLTWLEQRRSEKKDRLAQGAPALPFNETFVG